MRKGFFCYQRPPPWAFFGESVSRRNGDGGGNHLEPSRPSFDRRLARELSALGVSLRPAKLPPATPEGVLQGWAVSIEDSKACPHYTLSALTVKTGVDSPDWMKKRLMAAGFRSLGLLVDVTNYVLLELGQPSHVFDAERLEGTTILVRKAKASEILDGLDGGKHALTQDDLVIADGKGVVAIAGVVGG